MGEDGWVSIKLDLETKNFDAEIKKSENELDKLIKKEKELIKLNERYDKDTKDGGRFVVSAQEYNKMQKLGIAMEDIGNKDTFLKLQSQIEGTSNKIVRLREQQMKLNDSSNLDGMKKSLESIGNGVKKVTRKVIKWSLAVFGVRSAYLAIRQAMSILSEYDNKLKSDLQYIRIALASALEPIVRVIVDLVYKLLRIIAQIIQLFTGYNIFQNANKYLASANKNAKKLKNTIASFDEMNVLNDNSDKDNAIIPSQDLSKLGEIPEWMKNIAKIKDFIGKIWPIVAIIFSILFKIKKLGLYIAIYGIYKTFKEIMKWLKEPTFENFMGILQGISITVAGIAIAFGLWPVAIAAALALIVTTIIKNWDKIKEWLNGFIHWIDTSFRETMEKLFGPIGTIITDTFKFAIEFVVSIFDNLIQSIKKVYNGIVKITQGDLWGGLQDIFGGLFDIMTLPFRSLISFIEGLWNLIKKPIETVVNKIKKALGFEVDMTYKFSAGGGGEGSYGGGGGGGGFNRAKGGVFYPSKLPKLAVGGIINRPGPGVAYNGAYIGERGAEAVVPLTDSQQMELLGSTIGRYININLTNVTELDGREIARKVDKLQQNNNFVLNR